MEIQSGKHTVQLADAALRERVRPYQEVLVDLGTGDGRFVRAAAHQSPATFVLGIDSCRENLRDCSRSAPANALYLIANAERLPAALNGLATRLTINFPWGSLLRGLFDERSAIIDGLGRMARPGAVLDLRLNGGALAEAGWPLESGSNEIAVALRQAGWRVGPPALLDTQALRAYPTTWARRLGFGRDQRAIWLRAVGATPPSWAGGSLTSGGALDSGLESAER